MEINNLTYEYSRFSFIDYIADTYLKTCANSKSQFKHLPMDAATRNAIMRKKKQMHSQKMVTSVDVESIREATKRNFEELLQPAKNSAKLAKEIDKALHTKHRAHSSEYKSAFRRLYLSLKKDDAGFKEMLTSGKISPADFALKSAEELKSAEQQRREDVMKKDAIRNSTVQQLLPENVNQVKDGRDREKWGVSRSAAAIDD